MQTTDDIRLTEPDAPPPRRRRWVPGPQGLVVLIAAVASARLGLRPISDNSTLLHLKTGILLTHSWHVPTTDPYSFTALGHSWVVQSWAASILYGWANAVGHHALVILQGIIFAAVGGVIAFAARSTSAWRSGLAAVLAICTSSPGWSPRPLMFELLCLGLVIIIVERRAHPALLIPVVWLWVNTHGSWPVGLAWIAAYTVGFAIDSRGWPRGAVRYLVGYAAGLAVSFLNPIGTKLLTFPLVAYNKRSTFKNIVEWRSPNFQSGNALLTLVFLTLALIVLLRLGSRWAELLPACGFFVAGLYAQRNLAPLGVALAPALGMALARPQVTLQGAYRDAQEVLDRFAQHLAWRLGVIAAGAVAAIVLVALCVSGATLNLSGFPVRATNFLAVSGRLGPAHRIAAADVVGDYLIYRAGPATKVFIDDRYDMYPQSVANDAGILAAARGDAADVLAKYHVDTVLWSANQALPGELESLGGWEMVWTDGTWDILERT